ncbi:MAG: ABC transporter ATP-binding protein [Actinomycetota bacterium]|nr:ABC transporter ATP-binding protein [Rubrobacteraceae bacterium]MDQ3182673.1 ABC transporter ATP-binding protein [Actinomycetota bacterium]MDQ3496704.1 ABC transporter ATP-binding protein [Actinomycetota bacterium]
MSDANGLAAVGIEELTISYLRRGRPLRVIEELTLSIRPGEAYGLVGESGCGKSTVAMALMRYLPQNAVVNSGRITFAGEDLLRADEATLRRWRGSRMAMVYQDPASALNPSMRVGAQIAEVYRQHRGMDKTAAFEEAGAMLEKVRITDPGKVLRRYPHELSGGQQQRVMIAMALSTDPELLVLDEPTTGLDATVEAEVLDLVEQLRSDFDASILFISHNLAVVGRVCERAGVLYAGRLIEEGPSDELLRQPRHPYTLGLLRCVPRRGMRKDVLRLDPIPGSLPPLGANLPGCVYAPRCPIARERCHVEPPPPYGTGNGRISRCHYHNEVSEIPPGEQEAKPPSLPSDGAVLLRVEDLVKTYESSRSSVQAVAGVSFEVRRGEVFGLVGESGSGKTSLARCLSGLVDVSAGDVTLEGFKLSVREHRRNAELRRKVQMIFQNPDTSLNPRHSIRRILGRALRLLAGVKSGSERERLSLELASSVRLEPRYLEVRPPALSGGLKQRVAIARAFAGEPALVLCDEPVSALDVSVQAAILNLLLDVQTDRGVSYLFISHDLNIVRYLADSIGVMYLGQLVDVGPAGAVFEPPHHPYTEALLSAMTTLEDLDDPRPHVKLGGAMPSPSEPPSGCRFHTRCPRFLGDVCREEAPPWQQDVEGHQYRCHIPPGELRELQRATEGPSNERRGAAPRLPEENGKQ